MTTSISQIRSSDDFEAYFEFLQFKFGANKRADFYDKLAALIRGGRPIDASLRQLGERYVEKKRPMRNLLKAWLSIMDQGQTFADASRGYVSDTESIILAAGEKSGDLGMAFEQAALVARANSDIIKALRGELTQPVIQFVVLIVMMVSFSTGVAPSLSKSIPDWAFDSSQRSYFAMSATVAQVWWIAVPIFMGLLFVAIWSMSRYTGKLRKWMDKIPPWSIYRVYSSSTFMIALAALIKAGVPIDAAINFIRKQSSPYMKDHLAEMLRGLRAGESQGRALDVGLLNADLADSVAIYSNTGNFDQAMSDLGVQAISTGIADIKLKAGIAKIASIMLIGVFVGWSMDSIMGIGDAANRASQQQNSAPTPAKH